MARPATTYHLTPAEWWSAADPAAPLTAPSFADEGFIHCTTGPDEMVATANRHYRDDPRAFVVLTVELERVGSPVRIEDARGIYPHVFGPIDRAAIVTVQAMPRTPDGEFRPFATEPALRGG
ncbi:MAG TPA: DUF952 domain-containing protein [Candidatus Limnocylindrales bacterium]|nr:DUF952 domain-containing protein [Candidatus Limnocylindrales bacterium]